MRARTRATIVVGAVICGLFAGCKVDPTGMNIGADNGVTVRMNFSRPDFYAAPFPSDDLLGSDGKPQLSGFPNPRHVSIATQSLALVSRDAHGFAATAGIFFSLSAALPVAHLPTLSESVSASAKVFLMDVDAASPTHLARTPVSVAFEVDGGPYGAPNLLSLVPFQGAPLRPHTRYAAVVMREVASPALSVSNELAQIQAGNAPPGMSREVLAEYRASISALAGAGVDANEIAGLSVFTTDSPLDVMKKVVDDMLSRPLPTPTAFSKTDTFDDYCVYASTIDMPDYQSGAAPFMTEGGDWLFDATGKPILQRTETAKLVITIPRTAIPAHGFPATVLIRTGAGGDRPLVDRGTQATNGGPAITSGTGPALQFARAGYAGIQIDGPLGGLRNTTNADEQFLIFNVFNGAALRDNVRESAAEIVLLAHILPSIHIDVSDCDGATGGHATFDTSTLALMGHSMGASIAPLALAFEPTYGAAVLSGAGASWIENVMWKQHPLDVRPDLEILLGYAGRRMLTDHDPVLSLLQWAAEPADSQIYASRVVTEPFEGSHAKHILMVQGIVDHYIMPNIANALSVPLHLDIAGPELDSITPEIAAQMAFSSTFQFSGARAISFPVTANYPLTGLFNNTTTLVLTQQRADGIEDGHEVVFQTEAPKYEYKCFLESLRRGAPIVPDGAGMTADAPCPQH